MLPCTVTNHHSALLVTFEDGTDIVLQSGYDQAAFAYNCGLIPESDPYSQEWIDCDPTAIEQCEEQYHDLALADAIDAIDIDEMLEHYIIAALWSSTDESDESGGCPLDDNYSEDDIAPGTLAKMRADCENFIKLDGCSHWRAVAALVKMSGMSVEQLGHDFWLTRNEHGAGFWDRGYEGTIGRELTGAAHSMGEVYLYVGDDGLIHS